MSNQPKQLGFSFAQKGRFYPVRDAAWRAECERYGADSTDKELKNLWYRGELKKLMCFDEDGQPSTKLCDRVKDFDYIMGHFALLANDAYWIAKTARAQEDRLLFLIREWRTKIAAYSHQPLTEAYEAGIERHMHFATDPADIPCEHLLTVFQALDTHLRRILKQQPKVIPSDLPF